MDIDLEDDLLIGVSDDKIGTFLSNKYEEITLQNQHLETLLQERKTTLQSQVLQNYQNVTVENLWIRVFNSKYVIGFEVICPKSFELIGVILSSDSNLNYEEYYFTVCESRICSEPFECSAILCSAIKQSTTADSLCYVTLVIEKPQFLYQLKQTLSGYVICDISGQKTTTKLPNIELSLNGNTQINWGKELDNLINFLSVVSCNTCIDLVLCLPEEWTTNLQSTFEIFCCLTAINLKDQKYFIMNKTSDTFKDVLLVMHRHRQDCNISDIFVRVYYPNEDQLISFVHHMLLSIKNCQIVPKTLYKSVVLHRRNHDFKTEREKLENFKRSLRSDLEQSYFYSKSAVLHDRKKLEKIRRKLGKQEELTDLHYLDVQKM